MDCPSVTETIFYSEMMLPFRGSLFPGLQLESLLAAWLLPSPQGPRQEGPICTVAIAICQGQLDLSLLQPFNQCWELWYRWIGIMT